MRARELGKASLKIQQQLKQIECGRVRAFPSVSSSPLLGRSSFRLEPHELLCHVVVGALREDPHGGEARVVHVNALTQRAPASTVSLLHDVSQLNHHQTHNLIRAAETVVFHAGLDFVAVEAILVTQNTADKKNKASS